MAKKLVLFDFDGTISNRDSMLLFVKYISGWKFPFRFLSFIPHLIKWKLKLITTKRAKERLFSLFFGGIKVENFNNICSGFASQVLPSVIKPSADLALRNHLKAGDDVYIVSASLENWLRPWVEKYSQLKLLATQLEEVNGSYTGNIKGENCKGAEKMNRIKEVVDPDNYASIIAYGDSSGDKEMLEMADKSFYRYFT